MSRVDSFVIVGLALGLWLFAAGSPVVAQTTVNVLPPPSATSGDVWYNDDSQHQFLYRAADLTNYAGTVVGVSWLAATGGGTLASVHGNTRLWLGHTTLANLNAAGSQIQGGQNPPNNVNVTGSWTLVFPAANYNIAAGVAVDTWIAMPWTNNFKYNGAHNLVVQLRYDNGTNINNWAGTDQAVGEVWNVYDWDPNADDFVDNPNAGYPASAGNYGRRKFSAQFTIWTAYRCFNSTAQPGAIAYTWQDISATGTNVGALDDDGTYGPINIGFNFSHFGNNFNQLMIGNNGALTFNLADAILWNNATIPTAAAPNNLVAPMWDDLTDTEGQIRYQTLGVAPNRYFVVSWLGLTHFDLGPGFPVTFQAILCETSNIIIFQYQDAVFGNAANDNGLTATVGIEDAAAGLTSGEYSFNRALLANNLAICYVPNAYGGVQPYWPLGGGGPGGGGGGGGNGGGGSGGGGCVVNDVSGSDFHPLRWTLSFGGLLVIALISCCRRSARRGE
ncbi:MAG: hypothetical protein RDV41_02450 [Planctomycetota bacterium]|nr:hypothetical protein [Planctomycetota bacterium]